jgi:tetrahydromethanopterin S-methyltransferase subunit D
MRDIKSNIKRVSSLAPQSVTAATNGTGIDRFGFESAAVSFNCGAIGGTTPSYTLEVQESDDNATFTAVAAKDLQSAAPVVTTTNAGVSTIGYLGAKRYIRPVVKAVTGTSPTLLIEASVILGHPRNRPAA